MRILIKGVKTELQSAEKVREKSFVTLYEIQ